jgi:hypothetical protein
MSRIVRTTPFSLRTGSATIVGLAVNRWAAHQQHAQVFFKHERSSVFCRSSDREVLSGDVEFREAIKQHHDPKNRRERNCEEQNR